MLGIDDPIIILGYALAIGATIFCIVYGWIKRNEEDDEDG